MLRSMAKKLEIEMLYGQVGYATVASTAGTIITITTSEWAPGIWAGAENMPIDIRSANGTVDRGTTTVAAVSMQNQTVTVTGLPPGVVAGDVIWHANAYGNEFPGIHYILTVTTGVLFNINVATYNLFQANVYSAQSGALSFTKLNQAVSRAVEKGLDSSVYALVNPRAWANMLNDQAALRRYDTSYKAERVEVGSKGILFHSQNGDIEIEPSIYVKQGRIAA